MKNKFMKKVASGGLLVALLLSMLGFFPTQKALAAQLTAKSDTMSRLQDNMASNHEIKFTTPTGVAAAETITVTFPAGFNHTGVVFGDIDVDDDATPLTLAGTCSAGTWGAVMAAQVLTLTSCTGSISTNSVVTIKIGTNASGGANRIVNPDVAVDTNYEIAIGGTMADSGQLEVQILMDDTVNITASVDESISFSISDTTVEFGDLNSGSVKYADDSAGTTTSSDVAHTLSLATNATGGYSITYSGGTLTAGGNTIDVASSIATGGTPGSEQFAMSFDNGAGNATVTAAYNYDTPFWTFSAASATTPVMVVTEAVPTATETISVRYMANIDALTQSGNYSTDITYVATASF